MNDNILEIKNIKEKFDYLYHHPEKLIVAFKEMYEQYPDCVELYIDLALNGKHLTEDLLEKAIDGMDFLANTSAWTLTQTNDVAKSLGITFNKYNQYDFNFMMNWYMSDMAEIWGVDAIKYGKYAHFMLEEDPDNKHPEERAYCEAKKFIKRHNKEHEEY